MPTSVTVGRHKQSQLEHWISRVQILHMLKLSPCTSVWHFRVKRQLDDAIHTGTIKYEKVVATYVKYSSFKFVNENEIKYLFNTLYDM